MKSIRLLNEDDIKEIVAEKFKTTKEKVGIAIKKMSKGYGMADITKCNITRIMKGEHIENKIKNY